MARPDDEYWTKSSNKGFNFDEDNFPQDSFSEIFGASRTETAQLSKQVNENIPHGSGSTSAAAAAAGGSHMKLSHSVSSLSSTSSTNSNVRISEPSSKQCEITNKLLSFTLNVESVFSAQDVVRSIFLGLPFELSGFVKLKDKISLLDESLKLADGDVVTAVLLFLQKNLHQSVLFSLLKERPLAASQYIDILEKQKSFVAASLLCTEMQRPKDALVHLYKGCLKENDKNLLQALDIIQKKQQKSLKNAELEAEIIKEHSQLLEKQYAICPNTSRSPQAEPTKRSPLIGPTIEAAELVGSSLIATFQYCCRYNWGAPENLLASPAGLKKTFQLTEKQFVWNAAIGRILANSDPLPILIVKGVFGAPKMSPSVSVTRFLEVAHKLDCRPVIFDQLLPFIESAQERCQLGKRYHRHRIVIDVLTSDKDRVGLLRYRDSINDQSEIEYINNVLRVSSTRWKN